MAVNNPNNPTRTWDEEDNWWRSNFSSRPYASTGRGYDYYRPGYRYGFESGSHHMGRKWEEVETDLRAGWNKFEHRGKSTWDEVKEAVQDAWHRITGHTDVIERMSESGRASPGTTTT